MPSEKSRRNSDIVLLAFTNQACGTSASQTFLSTAFPENELMTIFREAKPAVLFHLTSGSQTFYLWDLSEHNKQILKGRMMEGLKPRVAFLTWPAEACQEMALSLKLPFASCRERIWRSEELVANPKAALQNILLLSKSHISVNWVFKGILHQQNEVAMKVDAN